MLLAREHVSVPVAPRAILLRMTAALLLTALCAFAWQEYQRASQLYLPYDQRDPALRDKPASELGRFYLFANQADFAALTTTPLTLANAAQLAGMAEKLLHYSPEPRVIEILVESLTLSNQQEQALWHLRRYKAAFPTEFAAWRERNQSKPRQTP
ncbi:MAG: Wzy polymerase domain-containing protein [Ramlibacter sp.]